MSTAFKVGLISLLGFITVMVGVISVWQLNPYSSYYMTAYFPHVGGLKAGASVELMGVKIGTVSDIKVDGNRVKTVLSISRENKIQVGSKFTVITTGLVGEKSVEIVPILGSYYDVLGANKDDSIESIKMKYEALLQKFRPDEKDKSQEALDRFNKINEAYNTLSNFQARQQYNDKVFAYYKEGDEVKGDPPSSLDAIFTEAQGMMTSARKFIDDPVMRDNIQGTIATLAKTTKHMEALFKDVGEVSKGFGKLTVEAETLLKQINQATKLTMPEIRQIVGSANRIAKNIDSLSRKVNQIAQDPEIIEQTKLSINNISEITDNLKSVSGDIREITGDDEIKENVKVVAKNAKRLTEVFLNPAEIGDDTQFDLTYRAELVGSALFNQNETPDNNNNLSNLTAAGKGNFNFMGDTNVLGPISHIRLGLDEIGDGNKLNLQLGTRLATADSENTNARDNMLVRFGLVRGKLGAGTDFSGIKLFGTPVTLTGEIYDISAPVMRLGFLQNLFQDYGLSIYWDNQFSKGINEVNIGFRWQPAPASAITNSKTKPVTKPVLPPEGLE